MNKSPPTARDRKALCSSSSLHQRSTRNMAANPAHCLQPPDQVVAASSYEHLTNLPALSTTHLQNLGELEFPFHIARARYMPTRDRGWESYLPVHVTQACTSCFCPPRRIHGVDKLWTGFQHFPACQRPLHHCAIIQTLLLSSSDVGFAEEEATIREQQGECRMRASDS